MSKNISLTLLGTKLTLQDFERVMYAQGQPVGADLMEAIEDEIAEAASAMYTHDDLDQARKEAKEEAWAESGDGDFEEMQQDLEAAKAALSKGRNRFRQVTDQIFQVLDTKGALDRRGLAQWVRTQSNTGL